MSIYNQPFTTREKITSAKLNMIVADANNIVDNIHPQFRNVYNPLGFQAGIICKSGADYGFKRERGYRDSILQLFPNLENFGDRKRYILMSNAQFDTLRLKWDMLKVESGSAVNTLTAFIYVYTGANMTPIFPVPVTGGWTLTTTPSPQSWAVDISALAEGTIITVDFCIQCTNYVALTYDNDFELGQITDIEVYMEDL